MAMSPIVHVSCYCTCIVVIVMTPLAAPYGQVLRVARVPENQISSASIVMRAKGSYRGIIVEKQSEGNQVNLLETCTNMDIFFSVQHEYYI